MTRRIPFLLAVVTLAIAPACASDYQSLRGEIDSYTPPRPYPGLADGIDAAPAVLAPVAAADDFAVASQRLQDLAAQWERSIQHPEADNSFLVPADESLRALAGAAEDPAVAGKALGDGFSLQTLETLTLLRSPMIKTREAETRAAVEAFGQAEKIDAVLRRYASLTATSMAGGGMGAAPDFPFPGLLSL
jgi:hypothetical protein